MSEFFRFSEDLIADLEDFKRFYITGIDISTDIGESNLVYCVDGSFRGGGNITLSSFNSKDYENPHKEAVDLMDKIFKLLLDKQIIRDMCL